MLTSAAWLNRLIEGPDFSTQELVDLLEAHSFPIEGVESISLSSGSTDDQLDVELTSNRGDCFSHVALASEIAAVTNRSVNRPGVTGGGAPHSGTAGDPSSATGIDNRCAAPLGTQGACPLFTTRLIRGVKVGPSPTWLVDALEAVGQRSINNVVDISNYVLFEIGSPSHAFDFAKVKGGGLIIRYAAAGETLTVLDGSTHKLTESDIVVADAEGPISLAGVMGGQDSGVTDSTTDILLEVATWDPATVRTTARRLQLSTDASYNFERTVDPATIREASDRLVELILEIAGGELIGEGDASCLSEGLAVEPLPVVPARLQRVAYVLGVEIPADEAERLLESIGFGVAQAADDVLNVTIPARRRHEITREIDLIEEITRLHGIDKLEVASTLPVQLDLKHPEEWAARERAMQTIGQTLTAKGFFETVTFSFLPEQEASLFLKDSQQLIKVDEERRKGAPFLRPSIIPSLLTVRRSNQDARVAQPGGVRLYEVASTFSEPKGSPTRDTSEMRHVAMLMDITAPAKHEQQQTAWRTLRGVLDSLATHLGGAGTVFEIVPGVSENMFPALAGEDAVTLERDGAAIGYAAVLKGASIKQWGLDLPVVVAELSLPALISLWPPRTGAISLPAFPGIRRDLSLIVDESVQYAAIESAVLTTELDRFESLEFVTTYRGKQVGANKKSVTLSLGFRDPNRTLRHEEVDAQMDTAIAALKAAVAAEIRI